MVPQLSASDRSHTPLQSKLSSRTTRYTHTYIHTVYQTHTHTQTQASAHARAHTHLQGKVQRQKAQLVLEPLPPALIPLLPSFSSCTLLSSSSFFSPFSSSCYSSLFPSPISSSIFLLDLPSLSPISLHSSVPFHISLTLYPILHSPPPSPSLLILLLFFQLHLPFCLLSSFSSNSLSTLLF